MGGREKALVRINIPANLTQQAYGLIRDEILRGKLSRKQRLTEDYFAQQFQISKSPIREALNRLEAEGLITIVPRKGAFLRDFSVRDVEEIYALREILESAVIRGLEIDPKTVQQLRAALERAKECIRTNNKSGYISADAEFHTILAGANKNSRLRAILESMHNQLLILRHRTFELSGRTSVVQHGHILQALIAGNRELAAKRMVAHIRVVREGLAKSLLRANGENVVASKKRVPPTHRERSNKEAPPALVSPEPSTTVLCAVKRRGSTAGESPARELVRSTR
jgi:DNA-binding GntR family transcriptional regulator